MTKKERRALGRGLGALISPPAVDLPRADGAHQELPPTNAEQDQHFIPPQQFQAETLLDKAPAEKVIAIQAGVPLSLKGLRYLKPTEIVPNPLQPRRTFREDELTDLVQSIREHGVLQPVLVRPLNGEYEIVAGERRWRASQRANIDLIPAIVRELDDIEALKIALVENLQRQQLSPIEEALGFQRLMDEFSLTQEQVAEAVGKSRVTIANTVRLLKLSPNVQKLVDTGELSVGHAKVLLAIRESAAQLNLAKRAIEHHLSVRALEQLVAKVQILDSGKGQSHSDKGSNDPYHPAFEDDLLHRMRTALGTRVQLRHTPEGKGKIEIHYFSEEELDRIMSVICPS